MSGPKNMSPYKLIAKPLPRIEQELLIEAFKSKLASYKGLKSLFLIGSASRLQMTEASDLDFVAIFLSQNDLDQAKAAFYGAPRPVDWPCDILWYLEEEFIQRSRSGGVCMIAAQDGVKLIG